MYWKIVYKCVPCFCLTPESSCIQELASTVLVSHFQLSFATWFRRANTFVLCLGCPFLPTLLFGHLYHLLHLSSMKTNQAPLIRAMITTEDHPSDSLSPKSCCHLLYHKGLPDFFFPYSCPLNLKEIHY